MYLNIGIDIAKNVYEVCIVDDSAEQIGKKQHPQFHHEILKNIFCQYRNIQLRLLIRNHRILLN